ncbi:hypothetical protein M9458_055451 [Cirrhinus mrigala]|uniref:Reverse transcriptase n=1 Tax=Cirrhinus mrigala TaxID=683832 RepID=A0ABD0MKC4_CIRMR
MGGAASRCRPRPYERTGVVHSHPALSPSVWMLLWLLWIPGHPHTDLYQRLLIIDRFRALGVRHRDVVLAHMKVLGLRLNAKKSVLSPLLRTTYLGVVWDLTTMQARLSPARIESILTAVVRVRKGRSLAVKQFQQLLGLMAAVSSVIPFGLLYMRPLQWWLRTKRFSPRGNPFHTSRSRGDTYVPWTCGGSLGSCLRAPCCRVMLATDGSLTGWGAVMDGHPAHAQRWSTTSTTREVCVAPLVQAGAPDPCVVPGKTPLAESSSYSWASQLGSRHPAEAGADARGVDASPRGGEADLESILPGSGKLYALKWKPFTSWCGDRQQDSVNCPVGTVLGFLQDRFSTGLAQSTLKVYVAAISAYHAPLGGSSVGRNPLVTRFLRGALRPRPLARCSFAKCGRDAIS